jgi:hypothetical protein
MKYYKSKEWTEYLENSIKDLLEMTPLAYKIITPSRLPQYAGVYLISETSKEKEMALYVGRTKNLQSRIYTNHLMGSISNARLKKYLIADNKHKCFNDIQKAKEYIRENCFVRWILESDIRKRGALEGYFTALFFPKYGISEEH